MVRAGPGIPEIPEGTITAMDEVPDVARWVGAFRVYDVARKLPSTLPTWAVLRGGGAGVGAPIALAVGDLDQARAADGFQRDEAVVAFTDGAGSVSLHVIDYNAKPGALTTTKAADGVKTAGSLQVAVGSFDGSGKRQIAVVTEVAGDSRITFYAYSQKDGASPALTRLGDVGVPYSSGFPLSDQFDSAAALDAMAVGRDQLVLGRTSSSSPLATVVAFTSSLKVAAAMHTLTARRGWMANCGMLPGQKVFVAAAGARIALSAAVFDAPSNENCAGASSGPAAVIVGTFSVGMPENVTDLDTCTPARCTLRQLEAKWGKQVGHNPVTTSQRFTYTMAAGAFDGIIDPTTGAATPWSVMATSLKGPANGGMIGQILKFSETSSGTGLTASVVHEGGEPGLRTWVLTPYDRTGKSWRLGTPTRMDVSNITRIDALAAEPPKHVDWLDGRWFNVSREARFNVELGQGTDKTLSYESEHTVDVTTTHDSDFDWGVHGTIGAKDLFQVGAGVAGRSAVKEKLASVQKKYENYRMSVSQEITSSTGFDDAVIFEVSSAVVFRYPVVGWRANLKDAGGKDVCPAAGCFSFIDISFPQTTSGARLGPGLGLDWYGPTWQNGNALSYPRVNSQGLVSIPADRLGAHTHKNADGQDITETAPLLNQSVLLGGTESTVRLQTKETKESGNVRETQRTYAVDQDTTVSGHIQAGSEEASGIKEEFSLKQADGSENISTDLTTGSSETTTARTFQLNVPAIPSAQGYGIATTYYYGVDGGSRVVHGVDLTASASGAGWWRANYGRVADPALNLPWAITMRDEKVKNVEPFWEAGPNRQTIRGFQVLRAPSDDPLLSGQPYARTPLRGEDVVFEVPVHNYSLVGAQNVSVQFHAVPVDDNNLMTTGDPVAIGGPVKVTSIAPQGTMLVKSPVWNAQGATEPGASQKWRIFAVLNPDGQAPEVHPLHGASCPEESIDPLASPTWFIDGELIDPMTGEKDTNGCGQNNQGFGVVVVTTPMPPRVSSTGGDAESVTPEAGAPGEDAVSIADLQVYGIPVGGAEAPTLRVGEHAAMSLRLTTDEHTGYRVPVQVFDGNPEDGRLIAMTTARGVSLVDDGWANFTFTPDRAGRHTLTVFAFDEAHGFETETFELDVAEAPERSPEPSPTQPPPSEAPTAAPSDAPAAAGGGALSMTGGGGIPPIVLGVALLLLLSGTALVVARRRRHGG